MRGLSVGINRPDTGDVLLLINRYVVGRVYPGSGRRSWRRCTDGFLCSYEERSIDLPRACWSCSSPSSGLGPSGTASVRESERSEDTVSEVLSERVVISGSESSLLPAPPGGTTRG